MQETQEREQLRRRKEDARMAVEVAGYVGDLGIKVLPGSSWTPYYPDPAKRDEALQQVLEGKLKPEQVDERILRPRGVTYDMREVHSLGVEGLVGKVREVANSYTSFDYKGYLQFLSSLQGKDISLQDATNLFSTMAANRSQAELIRKLGPAGRGQVREALKRGSDGLVNVIKDKKRTEKLLEVLKNRWLKQQGIISDAQLAAIETQVEDEIIKIADGLQDSYLDYVQNGTQDSKQKLIDAVKGNFDDIKRQQEQDKVDEFVDKMLKDPDGLPDDLRQEMEEMFNDFQGPEGDMPPDFQGSMSPSMDEMKSGESSDKVTPLYTIEPPLKGYYQGTIYNKFNSREVKWECDTSMTKVTSGSAPKQHKLKGKIRNGSTIPMYMPRNYGVAPFTLPAGLELMKDNNGTCYLRNNSGTDQSYEIDFGKEPHPSTKVPVPEEKADMTSGTLSTATQKYLDSLSGKSNVEKAKAVIHYMKNILKLEYSNDSKYNMIYKRNPSAYFQEIENHKQVDCDVAQTYFIALCRKAGVPARMVTGHSVDMIKDNKAIIHSGTGHAWSEVWDEKASAWKTIDATPEKTKNDDDKKDEKDKKDEPPQPDAPEEKADIDAPDQEPRPDDEPPDPGDVQKKVDDTKDKVKQGPPPPPSKTTPESVKEKMKKMMEKQKPQSAEQKPDGDASEGDQEEFDDLQQEMDEMQQEHEERKRMERELREQMDNADSLRELEDLKRVMEDADMYDDAKDKLEDLVEQKEEEAKDELREEIQKMKDDGFIDEDRADELLKKLEDNNDDVRTFEDVERQLSYESGLYNEYISIREEVTPLVDQWFEYFAERLPKVKDVDFSEDELSYTGRLDRREYMRPHNLLFGKVNNPPRINTATAPRFMASLVLDISGSMQARMRDSRKLLIFFAELFQKISNEYGYIMFSISAFDDYVEVIKDFDQKYDSPDRYQYGTGSSKTVKVRMMESTMARGGTDMGQAVWDANKHLNEQKTAHPDFLSAVYTISDGDTRGQLAGDQLRRFLAAEEQIWGEWWGDHIKCGFMLGPEYQKAVLAQYFGNKDAIAVPQIEGLIEKVMLRFDEDVQDFIARLPDQED